MPKKSNVPADGVAGVLWERVSSIPTHHLAHVPRPLGRGDTTPRPPGLPPIDVAMSTSISYVAGSKE
ncbi:hypothetical protein EJ06DRAFT_534413 [Trichodelitschia bisporula]|uniref:Uncharacterized protein n=1 Tax=Trichodelitschia bisporula TaxID=703511 RepID=A0A6G1HJA1_9PEZI|nr:hypothetical protein EJ06DRAFT_534413 [Trichodelitschia bisporula]